MDSPELLAPAGDLEKLKTAFLFGADAVYLGGQEFSLRAKAGNFSLDEIARGVKIAQAGNKKIYVAVNVLARNRDFKFLPGYLEHLAAAGVHGIIASDPGVMKIARSYAPELSITVSTQASVSNYETAAFYREIGANRIVLARELSLQEIIEIKNQVDIELEVFIHGAMCVAYSGRCLLSHYMTGRSANRGECAHPCRYNYSLVEEKRPDEYYPIFQDEKGSYILNSRDLCLIEYIPELIEAGIDAFKIEGRMKSPLYVASTVSAYRLAIDQYLTSRKPYSRQEIESWVKELAGTASRSFTNGFIEGESLLLQDINKESSSTTRIDFCGIVKAYHQDRMMLEIEQRTNFGPGEDLEIMLPGQEPQKLRVDAICDDKGQKMDRARHPRQRVFISYPQEAMAGAIIRRVGARH